MRVRTAIFALLLVSFAPKAQAEAIPSEVLDRDYKACLGGQTAETDPDRTAYCVCIRDGMGRWDLETYAGIAMEQSKARNAQQVAPQIDQLARTCIEKVLR